MTAEQRDFLNRINNLCYQKQSRVLDVESVSVYSKIFVLTFSNENLVLLYHKTNKASFSFNEAITKQLLDEIKYFFGIDSSTRQFKYLKRVKI